MKNKNLLLKVLTCLLLIPCFILPFIAMFSSQTVAGSTITNTGDYNIFADYETLNSSFKLRNSELSTFWMLLVSILVVVLAVLAVIYIVMFVMELCNSKCKSLLKLQRLVSFLIAICAVVAFISSIIAVFANSATGSLGSTTKLVFAIGSWLLVIPTIAGIVGLLPSTKKSKTKKKNKYN